jgi:hypothetical protein
MSTATSPAATPIAPVRRDWFDRRTRNVVLTVHIVVSVGLRCPTILRSSTPPSTCSVRSPSSSASH